MKNGDMDFLEEADYNTVMRREGTIVGYYGRTVFEEVVMEIKEMFSEELHEAKGAYITFYINENTLSYISSNQKSIDNIVKEIEVLINKQADIIFNVQYDNALSLDVLAYMIVFSGIDKII